MEKKPMYESRDDGTAVVSAAGLWLPHLLGIDEQSEQNKALAERIATVVREEADRRIAAGEDMRTVGGETIIALMQFGLGTLAATIQNSVSDKSEAAIMNTTFNIAHALTHDFIEIAEQMFKARKQQSDLHLAQAAGQA